MDLYYKQEVSVGFLVITATVIFVVGLMWLSGVPLGRSSNMDVAIVFENAGGLNDGDPVYVSGVHVGRVKDIEMEAVDRVLVKIEVPNTMPPHADATASVLALDFLGSMKVEYTPGTAAVMLGEGQLVTGSVGSGIQDAIPGLTDQASEFLVGATRVLNEDLALNLNETMGALQRALVAFEEVITGQTITEAQTALQTLSRAGARVDSILANPSITESINQLDETTEGFKELAEGLAGASTSLTAILDAVNNREGTLGMALRDSTLHNDIHDVLVSMRLLLDDIRERPGRYVRIKIF